jgi:hypothetical protein
LGKSPPDGYPSHPPPHASRIRGVYKWKERNSRTRTRNPDADLGHGERGENNAIINNSSTDNISTPYFKQRSITLLLLIALTKCAYLLLASLASKNRVLYSEGRANKRKPELAASPQSTTLHSTGNTYVKNGVSRTKPATATQVEQ